MFRWLRLRTRQLTGRDRNRVLALEKWLADNPGKTVGDFYASESVRHIEAHDRHSTLGRNVSDYDKRRGRELAESFIGHGVTPVDKLIDYGCGTLRIGRWLIDYLDSGNYYGLDLRQEILDYGRDMLDDRTRARNPNLVVITDESIDELSKLHARWIVCNAVINHIPTSEYERFFGRIRKLMDNPECQLVLRTCFSRRTERTGATGWYVGVEDLQEAIRPMGLTMPLDDNARLNGRHRQFVIRHAGR